MTSYEREFKLDLTNFKQGRPLIQHCEKSSRTLQKTSRDRPKSAPYPRLKNSKRTSKCEFTVLENRKTKKGPSGAPGRAKRGTLPKLSTFLSQLKGGPFGEKTNFRKKSLKAEKLKGETLWDF